MIPDLKFSIITVALNSEKTIERTILSVINQTYENFEYIIIDGGSSDKTINIIKNYKKHVRYWISEPDSGIYNAMNKGLKIANGEILYFLHSDDYLYDLHVIEDISSLFKKNTRLDLIYGNVKWLFFNPDYMIITASILSKLTLQKGIIPFQASTFVRKNVFETIGFFKENYKIASDFDFYCHFIDKSLVYEKTERIICNYSSGGASSDQFTAWKEASEIIKIYFGPFKSLIFTIKYRTQLLIKHLLLKLGIFIVYKKILQKYYRSKSTLLCL